jgi:hypothetical protein
MTTRHPKPQDLQGITSGTAVVRLSHTDCTAAALTQTITLATLRAAHPTRFATDVPANARIMQRHVNLIEEFSGGATATAVIDVGDAAVPAELVAAEDVFTGAGTGIKDGAATLAVGTLEAAYAGQVVITATGANVNQFDAGEVDIVIQYEALTTDALV